MGEDLTEDMNCSADYEKYIGFFEDTDSAMKDRIVQRNKTGVSSLKFAKRDKSFAPAGQTTQMIIGAGGESDKSILTTSENLYRTFKMKRVYYSAYIPVVESPVLPDSTSLPPLEREHRIYQADWLLRFYGFSVKELFGGKEINLDPDLDPKVAWALRNLELFPLEVNKASFEMLMRIPGIGAVSAKRIIRQRRVSAVRFEDLKKMGVVLKPSQVFSYLSGPVLWREAF